MPERYIESLLFTPELPEGRIRWQIKDGKCVSYGAITGEDAVREFIRYGSFNLEKNDIVLVYSDGFTKFLHDGDFVEQIVNFDVLKFEDYVNKKALSDYSKYGKEKTIVMFINKE